MRTNLFGFIAVHAAVILQSAVSSSASAEYQVPLFGETESTCGTTNDWQDVDTYDGTLGASIPFVDSQQSPVGQIQWRSDLSARYTNPGNTSGTRWCTGTLIREDLFLTAGHCFDPDINGWTFPRVNGSSTSISSAQAAGEMVVNFNFQAAGGNVANATAASWTVGIQSLVEYRRGGLDYAIVRLSSRAIGNWGAARLSRVNPTVGQNVTIIQHPSGIPKVVHRAPVSGVSGSVLQHQVDTLGGTSGSGVLNDTGEIVAVHTNGGCQPTGGSNSGVLISAIEVQSPIVAALLAPDQFLSGDWDGDGISNIGIRYGNTVLMDHGADGVYDQAQTYGAGSSDIYLVGDWDGDGRDNLAVRRGNQYWMDYDFDGVHNFIQTYGGASAEHLVGDWDGDGRDNIAVRNGNQYWMDYNFDGVHNFIQTYGSSSNSVVVGDWDGDGRDNLAVRSANQFYKDYNFDGAHDAYQMYGPTTATYLIGDWNGDGISDLANFNGREIRMSHNFDGIHDEVRRW